MCTGVVEQTARHNVGQSDGEIVAKPAWMCSLLNRNTTQEPAAVRIMSEVVGTKPQEEEYEDDFEKDLDWLISEGSQSEDRGPHYDDIEAEIDRELEEDEKRKGKKRKLKNHKEEKRSKKAEELEEDEERWPSPMEPLEYNSDRDSPNKSSPIVPPPPAVDDQTDEEKKYILEKIQQANRDLQDQEAPDVTRHRRLHFKEKLVDLVVPPLQDGNAGEVEGRQGNQDSEAENEVSGKLSELKLSPREESVRSRGSERVGEESVRSRGSERVGEESVRSRGSERMGEESVRSRGSERMGEESVRSRGSERMGEESVRSRGSERMGEESVRSRGSERMGEESVRSRGSERMGEESVRSRGCEWVGDSGEGGIKEGRVLVEKDGKFDLVSLKEVESQGLLPPIAKTHSDSSSPRHQQRTGSSSKTHRSSSSARPGAATSPFKQGIDHLRAPRPPAQPRNRPSSASHSLGSSQRRGSKRRVQSATGTPCQATYTLSAQQKELLQRIQERKQKLAREEEQRKLEEEEQKRQENELAFKAWLMRKREQFTEEKRIHRAQEMERMSSKRDSSDPEESFRLWLQRKQEQQQKERQLVELKRLEEDGGYLLHSREECERAFKLWLRRKRAEKRAEHQAAREHSRRLVLEERRARRTRDLLCSVNETKSFRFTEQLAYHF